MIVTFYPYFLEWCILWAERLKHAARREKKPKCIHVSQMYPNVSTQTVLRPSDDNDDDDSNDDDDDDSDDDDDDDDDSNDDRVGAVVEQFGRTEEQIY